MTFYMTFMTPLQILGLFYDSFMTSRHPDTGKIVKKSSRKTLRVSTKFNIPIDFCMTSGRTFMTFLDHFCIDKQKKT